MNRLLSSFFVLLAVLGTACGGNPNKPEPVCTEAGATNIGGPLPCVFPPAPVVDSMSIKGVSAKPNDVLIRYTFDAQGNGKGDPLFVTTSFTLRPETIAEATALSGSWNWGPRVVVCLTQNGEKPKNWFTVGLCFGKNKELSGEMQHTLTVDKETGITSTSGFWMAIHAVVVNSNREQEVKKEYFAQPVSHPLTWKD